MEFDAVHCLPTPFGNALLRSSSWFSKSLLFLQHRLGLSGSSWAPGGWCGRTLPSSMVTGRRPSQCPAVLAHQAIGNLPQLQPSLEFVCQLIRCLEILLDKRHCINVSTCHTPGSTSPDIKGFADIPHLECSLQVVSLHPKMLWEQ